VLTQVVPVAPLDAARQEACVRTWLNRLHPETRSSYSSAFKDWLLWLWSFPRWSGKLPSELLEWQENAKGRDRFILVDLMTQRVQEKGGTYSSMTSRLSHIRSFFHHNRVELPGLGGWRPRPTKEPVQGRLTVPQVVEIITHANLRDMAIFLTMFQSLMDMERFVQFNKKYAAALVDHLKHKSLDEPFRINFPTGRKKNQRGFYTYIHHDALQAWINYFDRQRGWPKEHDPIAVTMRSTAPSKTAIRATFTTIARKLRLRPQYNKREKTGVSPHEAFRDVVRSLLQTAKKSGFDTTCAEYWMGHSVDPYNYNKFTELEPDYVMENAKIAAEYLNVITGRPESAGEMTGEQLLQVIRNHPTLVQELAQMIKNQTGKENRVMNESAETH